MDLSACIFLTAMVFPTFKHEKATSLQRSKYLCVGDRNPSVEINTVGPQRAAFVLPETDPPLSLCVPICSAGSVLRSEQLVFSLVLLHPWRICPWGTAQSQSLPTTLEQRQGVLPISHHGLASEVHLKACSCILVLQGPHIRQFVSFQSESFLLPGAEFLGFACSTLS